MKFKILCTFISLCFFSHLAVAAVSLSATRVIYPQGKKEIALEIKNHGAQPVLTQNWLMTEIFMHHPIYLIYLLSLRHPLPELILSRGKRCAFLFWKTCCLGIRNLFFG